MLASKCNSTSLHHENSERAAAFNRVLLWEVQPFVLFELIKKDP